MNSIKEKYSKLQDYLRSPGSVAVAFSSGVDSTFLLRVAHDVLGDKVIAVTASSCSFPERELQEAKKFCAQNNIQHIICKSEELDIDGFRQNLKNRCYLCKSLPIIHLILSMIGIPFSPSFITHPSISLFSIYG